jgi:hypothetical protein
VIIKIERIENKKYYLIQCDTCFLTKWYLQNKCNNGKRKFCSMKCINSGRSHTKEWKKNMSEKNSGVNNPFYGKKHSEENKIKCAIIGIQYA